MGTHSFRVGRVAGIPIGIQPLWLAIVALITWSLGQDYFPGRIAGISHGAAYGLGLAAALLLFVSILLHELGHAVVARRRGVAVEEIDLWLLGGVARMTQEPQAGRDELAFAAAGPAVTALIAAVLGAVRLLLPGGGGDTVRALLDYELYVNAAVLGFNLLPAFPLDGGRILRAAMWMRSGDHDQATARAAGVGRAFGWGMVTIGVLSVLEGAVGGLWLAFIGMFLLAAAGAESQQAVMRERFGSQNVGTLMSAPVICIPGTLTVAEAITAYFMRHRHGAFPVIDAAGRVSGLLTIDAVRRVPLVERGATAVALVADGDPGLLVGPGDEVVDVLVRPAFLRTGHAAVVDREGRPVGMLSTTDAERWSRASDLLPPPARRAG